MAGGIHAAMEDAQDEYAVRRRLVVYSMGHALVAAQPAAYMAVVYTETRHRDFRGEALCVAFSLSSAEVFDPIVIDIDKVPICRP